MEARNWSRAADILEGCSAFGHLLSISRNALTAQTALRAVKTDRATQMTCHGARSYLARAERCNPRCGRGHARFSRGQPIATSETGVLMDGHIGGRFESRLVCLIDIRAIFRVFPLFYFLFVLAVILSYHPEDSTATSLPETFPPFLICSLIQIADLYPITSVGAFAGSLLCDAPFTPVPPLVLYRRQPASLQVFLSGSHTSLHTHEPEPEPILFDRLSSNAAARSFPSLLPASPPPGGLLRPSEDHIGSTTGSGELYRAARGGRHIRKPSDKQIEKQRK